MPLGYENLGHRQLDHLRYVIAMILVLSVAGSGLIVNRVFASLRAIDIAVPKVSSVVGSPEPVRGRELPAVAFEEDQSEKLKGALLSWRASQKGSNWSFYVKALDGARLDVGIDEKKQFETASIYKLFLLKPLEQKNPFGTWTNTKITSYTYAKCAEIMISLSDNPCAEAFVKHLGTRYIGRQTKAYGYTNTAFNRPDYFVTTTGDTGLLLARLYEGDGFDSALREFAITAMAKPKKREAVRLACADCRVMNKTGENNGVKHDAAIIEKNGKVYVVVIFSDRAAWSQVTNASQIIGAYL